MANKTIVVLQQKDNRNIEIFYSSWPRQVGDIVDGKKVLQILADESEKSIFIKKWNAAVSKINAQVRRENRIKEAQFWAKMFNSNPLIRECIECLAMAKAMGE